MAEHKAPTEVTIVPHEEKSGLAQFVENHWPKFALLAVAATAIILFTQYRSQQAAEVKDRSWGQLIGEIEQNPQTGQLVGDIDKLASLSNELSGTDAGPWALFLLAQSEYEAGNSQDALAAVARIRQEYPEHPLVTERYRFGGSETPMTFLEQMEKVYEADGAWRAEHTALYENPAPPAGAPRVRMTTDKGDVIVELYNDRAPLLTENFLKLCGEGFYNGTHFHRVAPGLIAEGGDPNSKDGDSATWGTEGADYTVAKEKTGLSHFEGYLGMVVKPGEEDPNGSLFYFTAGPLHFFNHRNVVFGKVVEGLDVVTAISEAAAEPNTARPLEPIAIQSTEVLPGA